MKIGIMSDSHDHAEHIKKSMDIFKDNNVEYVLHLGDFVNPNSVRLFNGMKIIGIFGNNDGDKFRLVNTFNYIKGELKGDFYEFEEAGLKFACYHGTEPGINNALITCGKYDVFVYGHTHTCRNEMRGGTLVLNPGTVHGFSERATVMVFDIESKTPEIIEL